MAPTVHESDRVAVRADVSYPTYMPALGPRLHTIASLVLPGRAMADIGTDHARLPVALVRAGTVPRAIACDLRPDPLAVARRTVLAAACEDRIELRLGDGLGPLAPGEVDTVVVAGMTGRSMVQILAAPAAAAVVTSLRRLVLAPNRGVAAVRTQLATSGWAIVDEAMVEEGGRHYPIVVAEPGPAPATLDHIDLVVGPRLRQRDSPALRRWLEQELSRTRQVLAGLTAARTLEPEKVAELEALEALLVAQLRERAEAPVNGP